MFSIEQTCLYLLTRFVISLAYQDLGFRIIGMKNENSKGGGVLFSSLFHSF